jgi:peptide/nickel transport system substrate-binding protein
MIDPGAFFGAFPVGDFDIALWFGYGDPTPYGVYANVMSKTTMAPQGQPSGANYARYDSPAADDLLAQWAATSDLTKQKDLAQQLMKVFADEAPIIPLWAGPVLFEYSTKNITDWPDASNPYALGMPQGDVNPTLLILLTTIKPK